MSNDKTPLTFENSGMVDCVFRGRERVAEMIGPESAKLGPLFAAAPELLESLIECVEALDHITEVMGIRVNPGTTEKAKSAIAKATGE